MKFELRVIFQVPIWGYAEVEADSLDEAINSVEDDPDAFDLDFNMKDVTPGEPEMEDIFFEVKKDGGWVPAT